MQIVLYSAIGAFVYLIAWIVPGLLIKPPVPRLLAQFFTVIVSAFFLPSPPETGDAFLTGQYAFGGGVILVGAWQLIQKIRGR